MLSALIKKEIKKFYKKPSTFSGIYLRLSHKPVFCKMETLEMILKLKFSEYRSELKASKVQAY